MRPLLVLLLAISPLCGPAQTTHRKSTGKAANQATKPKYEMKEYYFVMLTKGARRDQITDTNVLNSLQAGHMANMTKMHEAGKLMVAGPFGDEGNWRGLFIIDAKDKAEVEKLLSEDPAIAAGRLDYEIHSWWTAKNCVFK